MTRLRAEPLAFILMLSAALLLLLHQLNILKPVEDFGALLLAPAQTSLNEMLSGVDHIFAGFREAQDWRQKYEDRQAMIDQLLVENARLREKERENETLRELLAFKQANESFQTMSAEVIGRDPNPLLRFILIDRGSSDGLKSGMPVVTARGLVGQVTDVSVRSSKIMLITDLASSINVLAQETRATGVVQGDINGALLMRFVSQGDKIEKGNIILTSGLGDRFPKKLVVGQVQEVRQHDVDLFQVAEVRPSVDFQTLETVLVITNFTAKP
jgi:rod shape-determining protein MreC